MKRLIVTADDFGLSEPVNEAVEEAHRVGILTAASLMVTAEAAQDAVRRAKALPKLGVGLHLVFLHGVPALSPSFIPDLVGPDGRFLEDAVGFGVRLFFLPSVRRQLEAEMRAQLGLFAATGLPLDHVNGHLHFHQHPVVVGLLARLAEQYGIKAVRLPQEPPLVSWRAQREGLWRRFSSWLISANRMRVMRKRLAGAGIACNDHVFGLFDSGAMTGERIDRILKALPEGVSEIYCHPASRVWEGVGGFPEDYLCVEEFKALADPERLRRLRRDGVELIPFGALTGK